MLSPPGDSKFKLSLNHHFKLDPKFAKSIKKTESVLSITCFYGLKTYIQLYSVNVVDKSGRSLLTAIDSMDDGSIIKLKVSSPFLLKFRIVIQIVPI